MDIEAPRTPQLALTAIRTMPRRRRVWVQGRQETQREVEARPDGEGPWEAAWHGDSVEHAAESCSGDPGPGRAEIS